jgi:hypothetical protein
LTKAVEEIITEDNREALWKHVAELELENSKMKATVTESAEECDVLQLGNVSLLAEHNDFWDRCQDLEAGLVKARFDSVASITSLETKIKSAEAHAMDVAAANKKWLNDFVAELARELVELWRLYIRNIQVIGGLCSPMTEVDPSAADYISTFLRRWLASQNVCWCE